MASVIERLKPNPPDAKNWGWLSPYQRELIWHKLPALLALADAVESKDQARIESAPAELKKEAK